MSDLLVNIRFGVWHLQIRREVSPRFAITRNEYHRRERWSDGWFAVYSFFGLAPRERG